jgi:hypothetical protein
MSAQIVQLIEQSKPYLSVVVGAYGAAVFSRAENVAVDARASLGCRNMWVVWHRRDERGRAALEMAVQDAAEDPADEDAAGVLRQQNKQALRADADLPRPVVGLLPAADGGTLSAMGTRAIGARRRGVAVSGDGSIIEATQQ